MDLGVFWAQLTKVISPEIVPVTVAVYMVCFALKRAGFFDNRFIPIVAVLFGIFFEILLCMLWIPMLLPQVIIRGYVCGCTAVYIANLVKQMRHCKEIGHDE